MAVPIARQVRATLNLIASSFYNCNGSAATMQELARDCLRDFDAAMSREQPQPSNGDREGGAV